MFSIMLPSIFKDIALLLVRLSIAIAFAHEAQLKFKDIKKFAKGHDLPVFMAGFVASVELLAALSMLTGLLAQWAGVGIILLMLITTWMNLFKWHSPYWAQRGGWEYDILMLILAIIIVVFGSGMIGI